jgi:hypothetical protein
VEEQFYLVFPLVIALLSRAGRRWVLAGVSALALASFGACIAMIDSEPVHVFYHPQYRAWELLMGSFIALRTLPALTSRFQRDLAIFSGIALVFWSIATFDIATLHPGAATLIPCIGTLLVIHATLSGPSLLGAILSLRAFGFFGKISYSVYLWHWPIMAFAHLDAHGSTIPSRLLKPATCAASILLGWLSWKYIESPFRASATNGKPKPTALRPVLVGLILASAATLLILGSHGLPDRFTPASRKIAAFLDYEAHDTYREDVCFIIDRRDASGFDRAKCLNPDPEKKNYLLLGDSHGAHLWQGLSKGMPQANVMQATAAGCRPLREAVPGDLPGCRALLDFVFGSFLGSTPVDRLFLAGRWQASDLPELRKTLLWANEKGLSVTLFGPIVTYQVPLPRLLAMATQRAEPTLPDQYRNDLLKLDDSLMRVALETGSRYVSLLRELCPQDKCRTYTRSGDPLQFDGGHLTAESSIELVSDLIRKRLVP